MNNFGELLFTFEEQERRIIRNLESTHRKKVNCHYAVVFNETCLRENLLPSFTNIRLYDQAVQQREFTVNFREKLLQEELSAKKQQLAELSTELEEIKLKFEQLNVNEQSKSAVREHVTRIIEDFEHATRTRILKKLANLYGGPLALPKPNRCYINLSSTELTDDQIDFLSLGVNCQLYPRYKQVDKKANIAMLYDDLQRLRGEGRIEMDPNLKQQLQAESTKRRNIHTSQRIMTTRLKDAAEQL